MTAKPNKKLRRGDISGRIYDSIRSRVLSMSLAPGTAIDEAAIVREFKISRTPVRKAIVRLASEGLIVLLPNKGSQVAPLDLARIRDYLEASTLIQPFVTALAAKRRAQSDIAKIESAAVAFEEAVRNQDSESMVVRNRDFHAAIARSCGNELLTAGYIRLLEDGLRIARFTLNDEYYASTENHRNFIAEVVQEHREMVKAIERRDAETAERVAERHTERTRIRFSDFLAESGPRKHSSSSL